MLIPEIRYNCNELFKQICCIDSTYTRSNKNFYYIFFTLSFLYFTVAPENLQRHFYNASSYFLVTFSDPKLVPRPFLIHTLISSVTKLTHAVNFLFPNSVITCPMFELRKVSKKKKNILYSRWKFLHIIFIFSLYPNAQNTEKRKRERERKINK